MAELPLPLRALVPVNQPHLAALLHFWHSVRGDRSLPRRAEFSFEALRPWLSHVTLIERVGEPPRFRIRLVGTTIATYLGADLTGRFLEDAFPSHRQMAGTRPYHEVWQQAAPAYDEMAYDWPGAAIRHVSRLVLPCGDDGRTVDLLVTAIYARDPEEDVRLARSSLSAGEDD